MVHRASIAAALLIASTLSASPAWSREQEAAETAEAAPQSAHAPAIWTLRDDDTVMHLFGYASALPPGTDWLTAEFDSLLADAEVVLLETDASDPEAANEVEATIRSLGLAQNGSSLTQVLGASRAAEFASIAGELGVPMAALERMRPWLASFQLGIVAAERGGYDFANPPGSVIAAAAAKNGAEIVAIEGPADLMRRIASLPEADQVAFLMHAARMVRDDPGHADRVNKAWLSGDVEALAETLHGPAGAWSSERVYEVMLVERNKLWRQQIKAMLDKRAGTILVAVGAGHLAGPDSLVTMLRDDGLEVSRR